MSLNGDAAGSEFEKMAKKAVLENEWDRASNGLDVYRYDFASKVAQGLAVEKEDMFGYLWHWADYNIAFRNAEGMPVRDYHTLRSDCEGKRLSQTVKTHLDNRIRWAKEMIPVAERMGLRLAQNAFLGLETPNTPVGRAANNSMIETANESAWLPYELKGLEMSAKFFNK